MSEETETQEVTRTITIGGQRTPVTIKENCSRAGRLVLSSSEARDLILKFTGRALATPVTALTIVFGEAYIEISASVADIATELHKMKLKDELQRMRDVFDVFGSEIRDLAGLSYDERTKEIYKTSLEKRMEQRLSHFHNRQI